MKRFSEIVGVFRRIAQVCRYFKKFVVDGSDQTSLHESDGSGLFVPPITVSNVPPAADNNKD